MTKAKWIEICFLTLAVSNTVVFLFTMLEELARNPSNWLLGLAASYAMVPLLSFAPYLCYVGMIAYDREPPSKQTLVVCLFLALLGTGVIVYMCASKALL